MLAPLLIRLVRTGSSGRQRMRSPLPASVLFCVFGKANRTKIGVNIIFQYILQNANIMRIYNPLTIFLLSIVSAFAKNGSEVSAMSKRGSLQNGELFLWHSIL